MNIERFKGVVVASTTPFDRDRNIDEAGTRRMMNYYVKSGVNGIFLLSSTGEYFTISQEKREKFIDISVDEINGRLPVMAMVSDASLEAVLSNIDRYSSKNIDAVVLLPPYFYKYSQDELFEFYTAAADRSPIPLLLYNQPMRLPNSIELELAKALSNHKNIIGIKDTSSDAARLLKLLSIFKDREDFLVYAGSEGLAGYASIFGGNFVYALAAVKPELFIDIFEKGRSKDIDAVMQLQSNINEMFGLFDAVQGGYKDSFSNFTHGIKAALKLKGVCEPFNSQLGFELNEQDYDKVRKYI